MIKQPNTIFMKYLNYKQLETNFKNDKLYPLYKDSINSDTPKEFELRFVLDFQTNEIIKKLNETQKFTIINEKSIVEYHENHQRIIVSEKNKTPEHKLSISRDKINFQGYSPDMVTVNLPHHPKPFDFAQDKLA